MPKTAKLVLKHCMENVGQNVMTKVTPVGHLMEGCFFAAFLLRSHSVSNSKECAKYGKYFGTSFSFHTSVFPNVKSKLSFENLP